VAAELAGGQALIADTGVEARDEHAAGTAGAGRLGWGPVALTQRVGPAVALR
jgi:hypothetical protein